MLLILNTSRPCYTSYLCNSRNSTIQQPSLARTKTPHRVVGVERVHGAQIWILCIGLILEPIDIKTITELPPTDLAPNLHCPEKFGIFVTECLGSVSDSYRQRHSRPESFVEITSRLSRVLYATPWELRGSANISGTPLIEGETSVSRRFITRWAVFWRRTSGHPRIATHHLRTALQAAALKRRKPSSSRGRSGIWQGRASRLSDPLITWPAQHPRPMSMGILATSRQPFHVRFLCTLVFGLLCLHLNSWSAMHVKQQCRGSCSFRIHWRGRLNSTL